MALSEADKKKIQEEEEYRAKAKSEAQITYAHSPKDKTVAGLLAIFLGWLGIHKFYLGETKRGVIYLVLTILFSWTVMVPVAIFVGTLVEGIQLLCMSDEKFNKKCNYSGQLAPLSNREQSSTVKP